MTRPAKLPIGIQAFETIRENGYLYVDKTRHVFRMVDEGMFYFLARPRRFGKSLLVSTLKCLFQGRRELLNSSFRSSRKPVDGSWFWWMNMTNRSSTTWAKVRADYRRRD
ncbi:MAG: AAA family ATPase [Thermodesulfobacteriota bacterium]